MKFLNHTLSIGLTAISCLLISIIFLLLVQSVNIITEKEFESQFIIKNKQHFMKEDEFFKNEFNQNSIFLIGSSHVGYANATQIISSLTNPDLIVYNLSKGGDLPTKRITQLEKIIDANPKIVFYGISYRDFEFIYQSNPFFPIIYDDNSFFCNPLFGLKLDFPSNPHLMIKYIFERFIGHNKKEFIAIENTPFITYSKDQKPPNENIKLVSNSNESWNNPITPLNNYCSLKKIVTSLEKNNIKVVLFSTPVHEIYIDNLSDYQKQQFSEIIFKLKSENNISFYDFENIYHGRNVWADDTHISYYEKNSIFNKDIANMISKESKNVI